MNEQIQLHKCTNPQLKHSNAQMLEASNGQMDKCTTVEWSNAQTPHPDRNSQIVKWTNATNAQMLTCSTTDRQTRPLDFEVEATCGFAPVVLECVQGGEHVCFGCSRVQRPLPRLVDTRQSLAEHWDPRCGGWWRRGNLEGRARNTRVVVWSANAVVTECRVVGEGDWGIAGWGKIEELERLESCRTVELQNGRTAEFQNCRIAEVHNGKGCRIAELQNCRM